MSFYIFPVNFTFFSLANTKMMLALLGLGCLLYRSIIYRYISIWKDAITCFSLAIIVSLVGLVSMNINNTNDTAYATYIISMAVWFFAAYMVSILIYKYHRKISIKLVCIYFIAVCAFQCVSALGVEFNDTFKNIVDMLVSQNQDSLTKGDRLYGIGASLDTAGTRFSISLIMIVYLLCGTDEKLSNKEAAILVLIFILVAIVGNMIARTTLVGCVVSFILFLYYKRGSLLIYNKYILIMFVLCIALGSIVMIYLYNHNDEVYQIIRFGFEPFFNYVEGGEFATSSNQMLKDMYVFPDNFKTWIIGDGYFMNPNTHDPYYVGQSSLKGFYMGTDVGYLRLIFYFGLLGLIAFMFFLTYVTKSCCKASPNDSVLFISILILGFLIWLKVSTDLFFVMALFFCTAHIKKSLLYD